MTGDPVLEGFDKGGHHLIHAVPVNEVKAATEYLVAFAEQILCNRAAPVGVDCLLPVQDRILVEPIVSVISLSGKVGTMKTCEVMVTIKHFLAIASHLTLSCLIGVSWGKLGTGRSGPYYVDPFYFKWESPGVGLEEPDNRSAWV
jgi:hypothetical protein